MAKISGQCRKQTLHIFILSVPCRHSMNRERVPHVVKAWLVGRFIVTCDARGPSQANETLFDHLESDGIATLQRSIVLILTRHHCEILLKQLPDIPPKGLWFVKTSRELRVSLRVRYSARHYSKARARLATKAPPARF